MKKYRILIVILAIVFVGMLVYPTGALKPVKNIFYQTTKPFAVVSSLVLDKVSMFLNSIFHLGTIAEENQHLIKENLELQSQLSLLKEAQHENEVLKQEIGFYNERGNLNLLAANIIGRSLSGYVKSVVIDRGKNDDVKSGQAVVSQGYLVGTLSNVFDNTSEVSLITDFNSSVPVILADSRGTGLLRGGLSGLTVEDIPLNIEIKKGERVVTSGLGGDIPFGILVGTVENVISKKGEIFQKITVQSPIKIYYLEFVFIAK